MRYAILSILLLAMGCKSHETAVYKSLRQRSIDNQDSLKWNRDLLKRDKINVGKGFAQNVPLPKFPFPIADYDYYLTSTPLSAMVSGKYIKGVIAGDNNEDGTKNYHMGLFIATDDDDPINDFVESRNWPYFTAEGWFKDKERMYNWITVTSPEGFAFTMISTKLFDLRFGKTVFIFPEADGSFNYAQLDIDPNNFKDPEAYKAKVLAASPVKNKLAHK